MRYDGVFMKIDRSVKKETLIIAAGSLFPRKSIMPGVKKRRAAKRIA